MGSPICIDTSHHNQVGSFHLAYQDGIRLVIMKATQGKRYVDDTYGPRMANLSFHLPEMLTGAYHFGDGSNVADQVDNFLSTVSRQKLLVLDWENNPGRAGGTMTAVQAELFVQDVFKSTGRYPMIYSGNLLKETRLKPGSPLLKCELWLAQYSKKPTVPRGWRDRGYRLWQYTDGQVGNQPRFTNGVGFCDRSMFNGTADDLERWYAAL